MLKFVETGVFKKKLNQQYVGYLHLLWMMSVDSVANSYQFNELSSKVLLFCHIVNTAEQLIVVCLVV